LCTTEISELEGSYHWCFCTGNASPASFLCEWDSTGACWNLDLSFERLLHTRKKRCCQIADLIQST